MCINIQYFLRHSARWRLGSCPEVSPKFWRFTGCRKLTFNLFFLILRCSAFRICIILWGLKWTVWPWESIISQKMPQKQLFWWTRFWITWLRIWLAPTIFIEFFWHGHEKLAKTAFFVKFRDRTLRKLRWLLLKVNRHWNFGPVTKNKRRWKKKTKPQFWVFGSETNSRCSPPYELPWLFVSVPQKSKLWPCLFLTPSPTQLFFKIWLDFDSQ